jgi:hypothetical protein
MAIAIALVFFLAADQQAFSDNFYGEAVRVEPEQIGRHHHIIIGFVDIDCRAAEKMLRRGPEGVFWH